MISKFNGRPCWTSSDRGDNFLEFCIYEWEAVHVMIHKSGSYMPVGLSVSRARELVESLKNKTPIVMFAPIGYKGEEITLTVLYEADEIIFIARYKDSISGHVVDYNHVKDMVKVLNLLIDSTEQDIITRAKANV